MQKLLECLLNMQNTIEIVVSPPICSEGACRSLPVCVAGLCSAVASISCYSLNIYNKINCRLLSELAVLFCSSLRCGMKISPLDPILTSSRTKLCAETFNLKTEICIII